MVLVAVVMVLLLVVQPLMRLALVDVLLIVALVWVLPQLLDRASEPARVGNAGGRPHRPA